MHSSKLQALDCLKFCTVCVFARACASVHMGCTVNPSTLSSVSLAPNPLHCPHVTSSLALSHSRPASLFSFSLACFIHSFFLFTPVTGFSLPLLTSCHNFISVDMTLQFKHSCAPPTPLCLYEWDHFFSYATTSAAPLAPPVALVILGQSVLSD